MDLEFRFRSVHWYAFALLGGVWAIAWDWHFTADPRPARSHATDLSLLQNNPVETVWLVEQTSSRPSEAELCEQLACSWMKREPVAARTWIMNQDDVLLRDRLIGIGARAIAQVDPYSALEWAVGAIKADDQMEGTILSVIETWAESQPAQAARLVDELPGDFLRARAADAVARQWLRINPMTAYIWMKSSAESDRLLANFAGQPLSQP